MDASLSTYYHGTSAESISKIIRTGQMVPSGGSIYFSRFTLESCLQHGADRKRKRSFAIKVAIKTPQASNRVLAETPGVRDTLILRVDHPIEVEVLELYVRRLSGVPDEPAQVDRFAGSEAITQYLNSLGC